MTRGEFKTERISLALSKNLVAKIDQKCKRINRNRSNYVETIILHDLAQDDKKIEEVNDEIAIKLG